MEFQILGIMKIKHIFFAIFATVLLTGCEDFFDSVTDVDIEPHTSRLAVFAYFDQEADNFTVRVGDSQGYITNQSPNLISDATVVLSQNGTAVGTFNYAGDGEYTMPNTLTYSPNDVFRLDVTAPGYESVFSTATLPPEFTVTEINNSGMTFSQEYGETLPEYEVVIDDNSNDENFYAIEVYRGDIVNEALYHMYLTTNDVNIEEWWGGLLIMNDRAFNGNTYKAKILLDTYDELQEDEGYLFIVKSITNDMYQYAKSYTNYQYSVDNPFAEPVTVTSNMEDNGFGIFTFIRNQDYFVTE